MTGVFVDSAMQHAARDRSLKIQKDVDQREEVADHLKSLLEEMDVDGSGFLTEEEWLTAMHLDHIVDYLHALDISYDSCHNLWCYLDIDKDGVVDIHEFVSGMLSIKGPAKAIDMHSLLCRSKNLLTVSKDMQNRIKRLEQASIIGH